MPRVACFVWHGFCEMFILILLALSKNTGTDVTLSANLQATRRHFAALQEHYHKNRAGKNVLLACITGLWAYCLYLTISTLRGQHVMASLFSHENYPSNIINKPLSFTCLLH